MKFITVSGPPSSGKTAVVLRAIEQLPLGIRVGVVKFDCLNAADKEMYERYGIPVKVGIAGSLCPDHFFIINIESALQWGIEQGFDVLISESAGLCNRCSPHIRNVTAVCVIDNLSGINTPKKIGPMLKFADIVAVTKGDIVSQAEREVFYSRISQVNPRARIMRVNGITGQGCTQLARAIMAAADTETLVDGHLRFTMPSALCNYCLGQTLIGENSAGNVRRIDFSADGWDGRLPAAVRRRGNTTMNSARVRELITDWTFEKLFAHYPYAANIFEAIRLDDWRRDETLVNLLNRHPSESFTDYGYTKATFVQTVLEYIEEEDAREPLHLDEVRSIRIYGGQDKDGKPEDLDLELHVGEVLCIVGPTGSGKSRLLEDIECLAQRDTPTGRMVLVNDAAPSDEQRYEMNRRLVAHLTQNMNFVVDLTVAEFIEMHARALEVDDVEHKCAEVIKEANRLSGERFDAATPVTQLSGGQSRALMIADVAVLSSSPIILIDEIENAGICKEEALELLVQREKIVLMSTHNPVLALMGDRRAVLENGAVKVVIETTEAERDNLELLKDVDEFLLGLRERIRHGDSFDVNLRDDLQKTVG